MTTSQNKQSMSKELSKPFAASRLCGVNQCSVSLRLLFPQASFVGCADIRVVDVTNHSDDCKAGSLFAVITGNALDGHEFIEAAIQNGAASIMVESPLVDVNVPQVVVSNVRKAYAILNAALNGNPSTQLNIAAVTGTNGKTTVSWLIRSVMQSAHHQSGLLGTIEYDDTQRTEVAKLSTPDSQQLSSWLSRVVKQNAHYAVMEVTSHALQQHRLAGTKIDIAVVTNITQDHFDYHHNAESYKQCKATLFSHCKPGGTVILNLDDARSASLQNEIPDSLSCLTYSLEHSASVTAIIQETTFEGSRFILSVDGEQIGVRTSLVGRHNISNCLAAAAVAHQFGISLDEISAGIQALEKIPGRLERIDCGQQFELYVDFAHTDDALRKTISSLRELTRKRIIIVFGAGGDRDFSKRKLLGQAASLADVAVVTSDNPRTEDPQQIIQEICTGLSTISHVEANRETAIQWAMDKASFGDIVLIAGKGHETEQIIGTEQQPFDDRRVCRNYLNQVLSLSQQKQAVSASHHESYHF